MFRGSGTFDRLRNAFATVTKGRRNTFSGGDASRGSVDSRAGGVASASSIAASQAPSSALAIGRRGVATAGRQRGSGGSNGNPFRSRKGAKGARNPRVKFGEVGIFDPKNWLRN